jgi:hypothetical protein
VSDIDEVLHADLMAALRRSREARTSPDALTTFRMNPEQARELFEAGKRESALEHKVAALRSDLDDLTEKVTPLLQAHSAKLAVRSFVRINWVAATALVALLATLLGILANLDRLVGQAPIADADDDEAVVDGEEPDGLAGPDF